MIFVVAILLLAFAAFLAVAFVVARIAQFAAVLLVAVLVAVTVWFGYLAAAIFGISFAGLYQVLGEGNLGWAIAGGGIIMLLVILGLLRAMYREIVNSPQRLKKLGGIMTKKSGTQTH